MLTGRRNWLRFDNYLSGWLDLDNGIVQGDPLLMLLYLFYNAYMLDIAQGQQEVCLGYVDDMALVATAGTFQGAHRILGKMMAKSQGGYVWSRTHDSGFEMSKSVLVDFSRDKRAERPNMMLQGAIISLAASHKFLGIMINQGLHWHQQADYALGRALKWVMAYRRLARAASGINLWLMRQLYTAVAIPKMTYMIDVWLTLPRKWDGAKRHTCSVNITNRFATLQRMAALAITGAMCTTATDVLDLHAGLLPMRLALHKLCHHAMLRIAALPDMHPLYNTFCKQAYRYIKTHRSPLHELPDTFNIVPRSIEMCQPMCIPLSSMLKANIHVSGLEGEGKEDMVQGGNSVQAEMGVMQVYSDGSGIDGQVGAAAVLFWRGKEPRVLRYHLGMVADHTVYEVELVGLLLALHLLRDERDVG